MAELKEMQEYIEGLSSENQLKVEQCYKELKSLVAHYGDNGVVSLALVALEVATGAE
jgi:hypothetical protein